jgi:hypothetical protein
MTMIVVSDVKIYALLHPHSIPLTPYVWSNGVPHSGRSWTLPRSTSYIKLITAHLT